MGWVTTYPYDFPFLRKALLLIQLFLSFKSLINQLNMDTSKAVKKAAVNP